jgi:hypothetical protein
MNQSSGEPTGNPFATIDLDAAEPGDVNLARLHAQVLGRCGRIELLRRGGTCVLISKAELDSLEKALEILSSTDTVRLMRQEIALVARVATAQAPPPPNVFHPVARTLRARSLNLP